MTCMSGSISLDWVGDGSVDNYFTEVAGGWKTREIE